MGTRNNPGDFDCYSRAEPNEPMFTLLARDPVAFKLVKLWVALRIRNGDDPDSPKLQEASRLADTMKQWHRTHRRAGR